MEEKIENELKENEAPVEEAKENVVNTKLVSIDKPDNSEENFDRVIERERSSLYSEYTKSRKVSNIITVAIMFVAVGSVICVTQKSMVFNIIGWCLIGLCAVGLVVYYALNRNKFPNKTKAYIKLITKLINENTFRDEKITDAETDPEEKFDVAEVIGDGVYADLGLAQSRNVVRAKYSGNKFLCAEVALFKPQATRSKKEGPVFVGKYVSLQNELEMKGRIILTIKRNESPLDLPTKTDDLTVLKEEPTLVVYGPKETDYEKVLGKKFYKEFVDRLALKDHLINVNLVVWAGKSAVYFSYDDGAMGLPFDKPFDRKPYDQMADNLSDALELLTKIGK